MILATVLLGLAVLYLNLPTLSEVVSLLKLPFAGRSAPSEGASAHPRLVFLVLAHDEELLIGACLRALQGQDLPVDHRRILVIADNCSDRTAEIARAAGVDVWEREDTSKRGKPHAIAWALERLDLDGFDGLVIIDADTTVARDFGSELAARAPLDRKVLQPFIGVQNPDENALTRLAAVYERAIHGLAYRVKERAGLNVPLGVGMCLGTEVLRAMGGWPAYSVGEDIELYILLTLEGQRIEPVPTARITAQEASSLSQSGPQRDRWTFGKRETLARNWWRIARASGVRLHQRLDAIAELASFGPVVHAGFAALGLAACWLVRPPGTTLLVLGFLAALAKPVLYSGLAVVTGPSPGKTMAAFAYLPIYAGWRLLRAVRTLFRRPGDEWNRTARHSHPTESEREG